MPLALGWKSGSGKRLPWKPALAIGAQEITGYIRCRRDPRGGNRSETGQGQEDREHSRNVKEEVT